MKLLAILAEGRSGKGNCNQPKYGHSLDFLLVETLWESLEEN